MPITRHGYATRKRNGSTRAWRRTREIILANGYRCELCGQPGTQADPLEVDHITAVADGGTDELSNLRPIHRSHNRRRGRSVF